MTSPLVPMATINLDGVDRKMRMDLNALSDFESMTGKSILRGGLTDIANLELTDIRALLWACLVQEDESITIREVGRWIHIGNITIVTSAIEELVAGALPEAAEEGESEAGPLTGSSSAPDSGGLSSMPSEPKTSD